MGALEGGSENSLVVRTCAECGQEFERRRRGRPSVYCRPACRQRAWALRQARASLDADAAKASVRAPVPPSPPTVSPPPRAVGARAGPGQPAPDAVHGWVRLLKQLRAQLNDPSSEVAKRPWEHTLLYDALGQALAALDAATPGGLAWLERHD